MSDLLNDVKEIRVLRDAFGDDIILYDDQEESTSFRILKEFTLNTQSFAVLQSDELKKDDEVEIFRIVQAGGEPSLESIDDDDEYEIVSEIYDEMTFPES